MITSTPRVSKQDFHRSTGWELKPEGACRGSECIPLPEAIAAGEDVAIEEIAEALHLPVVHDEKRGLWAVGPSHRTGRALSDTDANFALPTLDGTSFDLASLRGKKVLVYAWAPY